MRDILGQLLRNYVHPSPLFLNENQNLFRYHQLLLEKNLGLSFTSGVNILVHSDYDKYVTGKRQF